MYFRGISGDLAEISAIALDFPEIIPINFFISGPKPNNSKRNVQTPKIGPRFWKSRPPRVFTREFCRDFGVSGVDFGVFRPNSSSSPIHPKNQQPLSRIFLQDFQFRHSNSEIFPPNTRAGLHAGGQKIKNPLAPRNKHRPSMACATSLESIPAIKSKRAAGPSQIQLAAPAFSTLRPGLYRPAVSTT